MGSFQEKTIALYVEGIRQAVDEGREHHAAVYTRNLIRLGREGSRDKDTVDRLTPVEPDLKEPDTYEFSDSYTIEQRFSHPAGVEG